MRILYGITKSNFGGAQRYVFDLASAAKSAGHEVSVLVGGDGTLVKKLGEANIKVNPLETLGRDISFFKDFYSFFAILKVLKEVTPDVFHVNSSKMGALGALAGRVVGIKKIIFTGHAWAFNEPRPWWQKIIINKIVWLTIILSHKTICVSEKTKQDVSWLPFIKNKLVVVRNGVAKFELAPRESNDFTVGTIAELHKIKGLDVLLAAWSKFIKTHKAKLVIMGEGEERHNLENMAKNMGTSSSITFRGFIENARSFLSSFDIFVLPSRSEAMPYVPLEAGLASLPVIASSVGGVPEIIKNNVNGILVPKENPEALLQALNRLAEDETLRKTLGENLKKTVENNFSLEKMVRETFALY